MNGTECSPLATNARRTYSNGKKKGKDLEFVMQQVVDIWLMLLFQAKPIKGIYHLLLPYSFDSKLYTSKLVSLYKITIQTYQKNMVNNAAMICVSVVFLYVALVITSSVQ